MLNETNVANCSIQENNIEYKNQYGANPFYMIFLFQGKGTVRIDFTDYHFNGNIALFTTPYQLIHFDKNDSISVRILQFHGDFYCIEYHKKEVACNGLLFNNIYLEPYIVLNEDDFNEIHSLFNKLIDELHFTDSYSEAVARAYLQLILALSSKVKIKSIASDEEGYAHDPVMQFKSLLESHFKQERKPSFYAEQLGIAPNTFSKKCKLTFMRTPSQLIQDRVILEAKKLIHLTYKSMKEIATELNFDDENYFSRYFKTHTGITPTTFRKNVGISIVADSSR